MTLSPFKSNKFAIGTDSLSGEYEQMKLSYNAIKTNILGKEFNTEPTITIKTNMGTKRVLWSKNQYTIRISGKYINKIGVSTPFKEYDKINLFYDSKYDVSFHFGL